MLSYLFSLKHSLRKYRLFYLQVSFMRMVLKVTVEYIVSNNNTISSLSWFLSTTRSRYGLWSGLAKKGLVVGVTPNNKSLDRS